jgi:hypothetical protein
VYVYSDRYTPSTTSSTESPCLPCEANSISGSQVERPGDEVGEPDPVPICSLEETDVLQRLFTGEQPAGPLLRCA